MMFNLKCSYTKKVTFGDLGRSDHMFFFCFFCFVFFFRQCRIICFLHDFQEENLITVRASLGRCPYYIYFRFCFHQSFKLKLMQSFMYLISKFCQASILTIINIILFLFLFQPVLRSIKSFQQKNFWLKASFGQ